MDEELTINQRFIKSVNYLIESKSVKNKTDLAGNLKISKSKFSEILNERMNVGLDTVALYTLLYEIDVEWLLNGRGNMIKSENLPKAIKSNSQTEGIPLIPLSAMGGIATGEISVLELECERYVVPMFTGADYLIPVKGSSMVPKYSSGDVVACKRIPMRDIFFQWNKVYVLDTDQGPIIKRVGKSEKENSVKIISENPKYEPFDLKLSQIYAVSIVIGVIRLE